MRVMSSVSTDAPMTGENWAVHWVEGAPGMRLRVAVREGMGDREGTVVLLHGLGDCLGVWDRVADGLSPSYRLIAPDLRGHGSSSWVADGVYDAADAGRDVAGVVEALSAGPVVLVGHSLGAEVALRACAAGVKGVAGIVVVDATIDSDSSVRALIAEALLGQARSYPSPEAYAAGLMQRLPLGDGEAVRRFARWSLASADGAWHLGFDEAVAAPWRDRRPDFRTLLAGSKKPTLVVRGQGSGVLSADTADRMATLCGGRPPRTIPVCGHAIPLEQPVRLAEIIDDFVAHLLPSVPARSRPATQAGLENMSADGVSALPRR